MQLRRRAVRWRRRSIYFPVLSRIPLAGIAVVSLLIGACADKGTKSETDVATDSAIAPVSAAADSSPERLDFTPRMGWLLTGRAADVWGLRLGGEADRLFVVLDSLVGRDGAGKARWQVMASVQIGSVEPDEAFVPLTCRQGGVSSPDIFAVVRDDGTELLQAVRAWRSQPTTHSFEVIDPTTVLCIREIP
jgi:hypothetical protein